MNDKDDHRYKFDPSVVKFNEGDQPKQTRDHVEIFELEKCRKHHDDDINN